MQSSLSETSCGRYERVMEMVAHRTIRTPSDVFEVLTDSRVKMECSVQHMVFHAATGHVDFRAPE
jgi:hypothetical protein